MSLPIDGGYGGAAWRSTRVVCNNPGHHATYPSSKLLAVCGGGVFAAAWAPGLPRLQRLGSGQGEPQSALLLLMRENRARALRCV